MGSRHVSEWMSETHVRLCSSEDRLIAVTRVPYEKDGIDDCDSAVCWSTSVA